MALGAEQKAPVEGVESDVQEQSVLVKPYVTLRRILVLCCTNYSRKIQLVMRGEGLTGWPFAC